MTWDEIPLYEAIYDVYPSLENPRADRWLRDKLHVEWLYREVNNRLPIDVFAKLDQIHEAWKNWGRTNIPEDNGVSKKKLALLVEVARAHGKHCFYRGRGKGECSNDVSIDRIVPGARGGKYTVENCVLACGLHNSQRGDTPIEEYLTPSPAPEEVKNGNEDRESPEGIRV